MVITDLTRPTAAVLDIITAVADGDLSIERAHLKEVHTGEYSRILFMRCITISGIYSEMERMLENLNTFSEEVTRLIRDVGVEGKITACVATQLKLTFSNV